MKIFAGSPIAVPLCHTKDWFTAKWKNKQGKDIYSHRDIQPKHTKQAHSKKKKMLLWGNVQKTPKNSLVCAQKPICWWYVELMSQVKQTRNLSTNNSLRYSVFFQNVGTKKPVTQPRLELRKCEMKKGMEKKFPDLIQYLVWEVIWLLLI